LSTGVVLDQALVRNATILCALERRSGKTVSAPPPIVANDPATPLNGLRRIK